MVGLVLLLSSCSVVFPGSVRSAGLDCSDSRFWLGSDLVLAGGSFYLANEVSTDGDSEAANLYLGFGAVFAASAVYGYFKRRNCANHLEQATPEQWAAYRRRNARRRAARARRAEEQRRLDAERRRENIALLEAYQQDLEAQRANTPRDSSRSNRSRSGRRRSAGSRMRSITYNGCPYRGRSDRLGRRCSLRGEGCPGGYTCEVQVGDSGVCLPSDQLRRCSRKKGYKTVGGRCKSNRDCRSNERCKLSRGKSSGYCLER
ncbi:MAG: hypothetical protein KJO07_15695 [Deltaproteobacteria bacterium]|nr:hypothetical protein [Deltaproteobacteria bacterium]